MNNTSVAPAPFLILPRVPEINGRHIAELLEDDDALLVQLEDGSMEVSRRELPGGTVLRVSKWARDLHAQVLADALEAGVKVKKPTALRQAADAGNLDLAGEHAELAALVAEFPTALADELDGAL